MKFILLIITVISLMKLSFCQDKKSLYFDEISFGLNQSYIKTDYIGSEEFNALNQFGVNLEATRIAFKGKRLNFIYGFEYNMVNLKLDYSVDYDHYNFQREHYITNHKITIPTQLRVNFGERYNFFIEIGAQLDFIDLQYGEVESLGFLKDGLTATEYHPYKIESKSNYFNTGINFGGNLGLGYKFQGLNRNYIAKFSYRQVSRQSSTKTGNNNIFNLNYFKFSLGIDLNGNRKTVSKNENRKFSHTFYLGNPRGLFHGSDLAISGHYEFGFLKNEKNMQELKVSYVLYKFSSSGGWLSFGQLNGNSQTFLLQYGGRHYFNKPKNKIRPYLSGHIGGELVNYENGKNLILPAFSGGIHIELDHRLNIGLDVEGLMPNAYMRIGYRFY